MAYFAIMAPGQKLTKNFRIREFLVSRHHPQVAGRMTLTPFEIYKLKLLATTLLQPARDRFGKIIITSGKRSEELNVLVGGSKTSQHLECEAVDFVTPDADLEEVFHWIRFTLPHAWWQLILEYGDRKMPSFGKMASLRHIPVCIHASIVPEFPSKVNKARGIKYRVRGKYYLKKPKILWR